jgi:hypothetical protein
LARFPLSGASPSVLIIREAAKLVTASGPIDMFMFKHLAPESFAPIIIVTSTKELDQFLGPLTGEFTFGHKLPMQIPSKNVIL